MQQNEYQIIPGLGLKDRAVQLQTPSNPAKTVHYRSLIGSAFEGAQGNELDEVTFCAHVYAEKGSIDDETRWIFTYGANTGGIYEVYLAVGVSDGLMKYKIVNSQPDPGNHYKTKEHEVIICYLSNSNNYKVVFMQTSIQ